MNIIKGGASRPGDAVIRKRMVDRKYRLAHWMLAGLFWWSGFLLATSIQAQQSSAASPTSPPQTPAAGPTPGELVQFQAETIPLVPLADTMANTAAPPSSQAPIISTPKVRMANSPGVSSLNAPGWRAKLRPLPDLSRIGVDVTEQRSLSMREAIEMALANNKEIEVARQTARSAEFNLLDAQGVYDPGFSSSFFYERARTPTSSFLSGGAANGAVTQGGFTGTVRLEGLAPKYGGSYNLDFSSTRATTNNQFSALTPQYPTSLSFNYTQPLRRGLKFDNNRRQVEIAKKNLALTDAQFRQRAIETITNVQRTYWDLVFALRNLQIHNEAVRDARTQLEHNQRQVAQGALAPIDVVAAEAQVLEFERNVYAALEEVARTENALKSLIVEHRQSPLWNVSLLPTDQADLTPPVISLPEALEAALANRAEVQQLTLAREVNEIDQRYYRDQTKSQVDFVATYSAVGLAGTLSDQSSSNPLTAATAQAIARVNQLSQMSGLAPLPTTPAQTLPDTLVGGYGQSLSNLALNRFNNFRVGVSINIPFWNRKAEAQLGNSLVEAKRIETRREQLELSIQVDVRNALQGLRSAASRLRAAELLREAATQQLSSEQRKFTAGQSTFFFVLERQTALANARGHELRAQMVLNKAIAELQLAMGNALQANEVVISVR